MWGAGNRLSNRVFKKPLCHNNANWEYGPVFPWEMLPLKGNGLTGQAAEIDQGRMLLAAVRMAWGVRP